MRPPLTRVNPVHYANSGAQPGPAARAAIACWLSMLLALALGVVLICRDAACGATAFDVVMMRFAHETRTPRLDELFAFVTWGGSLLVLVPVTLCIVLQLATRRRHAEAWFLAAALAGGSALSHIGKFVIARPRPALFEALTAMPTDLAYPSAHSAQITAFAVALYLLLRRGMPGVVLWVAPLLVIALALIAVSRVYLQVHYPSDVLAGVVTGALWVAGLAALMLRPTAKYA